MKGLKKMNTRRRFLQRGIEVLWGIGLLLCTLPAGASAVWAKAKRIILPKGLLTYGWGAQNIGGIWRGIFSSQASVC